MLTTLGNCWGIGTHLLAVETASLSTPSVTAGEVFSRVTLRVRGAWVTTERVREAYGVSHKADGDRR